ncbi:hypothetical protein J132_00755 [Termitomyces sp. J132]|nr:hypothetical protein C0989_009702 [Termitomyces sp. Mn162]KNZ78392.1 hypothetical protein J132_00755 [Termitomyces sp. J132]
MLTQDPAATATFKFTGVAVYYMSPLWPYRVNTAVSLDSGPVILLDLVDHSRPNVGQGPETVQSQVIWGSGELSNTQHTLVISVGAGQPYAIVDALVYTALDSSDITTSASASSTTSTPGSTQVVPNSSSSSATSAAAASTSTSVDASKSASIHVLPIALGTVLGVLALLLILLGIWFCIRRKRRPVSEAWTVPGTPYPGSPPVAPMMSSAPGREINGGDYVYTDVNQSYNNSWGGGPGSSVIPGAMSPAMATAYAHSYASTPPTTDQPKDDGWQGTTAQIAQRYMRSPSRYQPTTLSTITETSPQGSPLANSTGSYAGNLSNDSVGAYATPENRESLFPVLQTSSPDPQYISNRTYGL